MPTRFIFFITLLTVSTAMASLKTAKLTPMPLPKSIRIESASMREKVWDRLTAKQKKLAFHFIAAGRAGKDLLFFQNHRHGLTIKSAIERSLSEKFILSTKKLMGKESFAEYLIYSAKFLDMSGPYSASNRKYILKKTTKKSIHALLKVHAPTLTQSDADEITALLTDPNFEVQRYPEDPQGLGLEITGGNLYEKGITGKEVLAAVKKGLNITLNCRVARGPKGLICEPQTTSTPGFIGARLQEVVSHLEKAKQFAETDFQKKEIDAFVTYFKTGDIEEFRQASIAWVRDRSNSTVDFMLGWIEIYEDWLARIGSWEAKVDIVDPEISKIAQSMASHAQYFENKMPYGKFKKTFPKDYSPPAMMVYYFQEIASYRSGGFNLPNFDDIRRDVGAKNVIRLPLPGQNEDPEFIGIWKEVLAQFAPAEKATDILENREMLYRVLVLLHEIIGHGSGTYDVAKYDKDQDPIAGLGSLGSALEEQRADLTALVFAGDEKIIEVGLYKSKDEAKKMRNLMYDFYLVDFMRRTSGERTFTEAHQRGHWLYIKTLLDKGAIGWRSQDGKAKATLKNQVLVVLDYDKVHQVSVDLLAELQRIKAVRDVAALEKLFKNDAPLAAIDESWAKTIIERGSDLRINAGYVEQPWAIDSTLKYQSYGGRLLESIAPHFTKMN